MAKKEETAPMPKNVYACLNIVQTELNAPKNQFNNFGNYKYRNCEDILEALKPHLKELKAVVIISDSIEVIQDRFYVKATAKFVLTESGESIENIAYAREELTKKGMDGAQVTGATSSYARKYALNGLFLVDDSKDADSMDNSQSGTTPPPTQNQPQSNEPEKDWLDDITQLVAFAKANGLSPAEAVTQGRKKYKISKVKAKEIEEGVAK